MNLTQRLISVLVWDPLFRCTILLHQQSHREKFITMEAVIQISHPAVVPVDQNAMLPQNIVFWLTVDSLSTYMFNPSAESNKFTPVLSLLGQMAERLGESKDSKTVKCNTSTQIYHYTCKKILIMNIMRCYCTVLEKFEGWLSPQIRQQLYSKKIGLFLM